MRLDIDSLQVESFPTAASHDDSVNTVWYNSERETECWGCSGSSVPSCEVVMCEPEHVPDTYFEPCSAQMTCPRRTCV